MAKKNNKGGLRIIYKHVLSKSEAEKAKTLEQSQQKIKFDSGGMELNQFLNEILK